MRTRLAAAAVLTLIAACEHRQPVFRYKLGPPNARTVAFDPQTMTAPVFVSGPDPVYTRQAWEREVQGTILATCVITADGRARDCHIRKQLPFLKDSVVQALEQWRFTPATRGGEPLEVDYPILVEVRLK
jgi:protein TonB